MGVLRDKSKKEASGWDGRGVSHRHLPNQTQLSGVCVTVCTCVCVCARVFGERKKERKDYGNTSSLAHSNRGKHHKALACTTHTHTPTCTHTHSHTNPRFLSSFSSRLSTRASIQRGQPKRGESSPDNSPSYPNRIQSVHKGL